MKTRIFTILTLCASILLSSTACKDNSCKHNVGSNSWQTAIESTCVATGTEEGICSLCYQTVTRIKPIDPDAHAYGEWKITNPTRDSDGTATTVCTLCGNIHNATLPKLDDNTDSKNYKSSTITKRPSPAKPGIRTYTFEDKVGEIIFDVEIPSSGINSLRDAVEVASMAESRELIRRADGKMGFEYYIGETASGKYGLDDFSYEFGDNYTHLVDGIDNCERWYFKDITTNTNGEEVIEYYGLTDFGGSLRDEYSTVSGSKQYFEGSRLYFEYCLGLGYFHGAENLLDGLYRAARSSTNNDYVENIDSVNHSYNFSFGSLALSGDSSQYFSIISVNFTFNDSLTINTLDAICTTYVNNSHSGIKTWELNEETGYASIIPGKELGDRYICEIRISQTLKAEGDQVPQNPYSCENMFVNSFQIYDSTEDVILQPGVPALITANAATQSRFKIVNILPITAEDMLLDSFSFYYRTKDAEGNNKDIPIDYASLDSVGVNAYYNQEARTLSIKTTISGEITVVIKTKKYFEYELLLSSDEKRPTKLYPSLLSYSSDGYQSQEFTTTSVTENIEVAVGQPIYFKARVDKNYESALFNYSVTGKNSSGTSFNSAQIAKNTNVTEGHLAKDITDGAFTDNFQYHAFEANTIGTYTVQLSSVLNKNVKCTFKITVVDAPTVIDVCAKSYTQELNYPEKGTVNVSFALATEADIPLNDNGAIDTSKDYYIATVEFNGMTEYLLCEWAVPPSHITGENGDNTYVNERKYLTTSHLRGVEQNFSIEWNEGYDLVLSHPTGFGSITESVILKATN